MPQTVPSAGFTPPCDYSNFADNFDLSLLPGGDCPILPVSPSTTLYTSSPPPSLSCGLKAKLSYFPCSPQSLENNDIDLGPDFQKLLGPEPNSTTTATKAPLYPPSPIGSIYLEVPSSKNCHPNSPTSSLSPYSPQSLLSPSEHFPTFPSPTSEHSFYPGSPSDISLYPHSPNSYYSQSPSDNYQQQYIKKEFYPNSPASATFPTYIKEENFISPCSSTRSPTSPLSYSNLSSPPQINVSNADVIDLLGNAIIKQETSIDFENILQSLRSSETQTVPEKPKSEDHQLLREVLRDTSFQKKYNIRPFDFELMDAQIKIEEPEEDDMMNPCGEQLPSDKIDPVLNLAIEQMRKDVRNTCAALGISPGKNFMISGHCFKHDLYLFLSSYECVRVNRDLVSIAIIIP